MVADLDVEIVRQGVFDASTSSERSCIREAVGRESVQPSFDLQVVNSDLKQGESPLFPCVAPAGAESFHPHLLLGRTLQEDMEPSADDHADTATGATIAEVGVTVEGAVDSAGDVDYFVFPAQWGQIYEIDVTPGTRSTVFDTDGTALAHNSAAGGSRIYWSAPSSGDYFVAVGGYGTETGSYALTITRSDRTDIADDHADTAGGATTVEVGVAVEGTADYTGDVDYFVFAAQQGQRYQIDPGVWTTFSLFDANETELLDRWNTFPRWPVYYWSAPSSGAYYVAVSKYFPGSSYTLEIRSVTISDDHADTAEGATTVEVGVPIEGSTIVAGYYDVDYFVFSAQRGQLYEIDMTPDSWLWYPEASLFDADQTLLAHGGDELGARIYWSAPISGDYYVAVNAEGTGSYTLTIAESDRTDDHAHGPDGATTAAVGVAVEGAVDYRGDVDYFVFAAQGGRIYEIDVALGTLAEDFVNLFDADLARMAYRGGRCSRGSYWLAPTSGDHYLAVRGKGTGSYTVTITGTDLTDDHAECPAGATTVELGAAVEGAVDYTGDDDYFAFTAEQGHIYEIDVTPGTLAHFDALLYDTDRTYIGRIDFSPGSRSYWPAPTSGDYYVAVTGYSTGTYTLTITETDLTDDHADTVDGATTAIVGVAVEGAVDYTGDVDSFVFAAQQGQIYEFDLAPGAPADSQATPLDPWATLFDADGRTMTFPDRDHLRGSRISWSAPTSGGYYLAVRGTGTGSYTLTITGTGLTDDHADSASGATDAAVGVAVEGAVDYTGDDDYFIFAAQGGQIYEIDVTPGTPSDPRATLFDTRATLFDADQTQLAYSGNPLGARIYWSAPTSGDYYVAVDGEGTGSYTVTITRSDLTDLTDDHADSASGATTAEVGVAVEGAVYYTADVDYFIFAAQQGQIYEIDVTHGTPSDSRATRLDARITLFDANHTRLADSGDSLGARISWSAPTSGHYYVAVSSSVVGSYTLTITESDIIDDHADHAEGATIAAIGVFVEGAVEYADDVDYFVFAAQQGQIYAVDFTCCTLATLFDADGTELAHHDPWLDKRISWLAPTSGYYYIAVSSHVPGSYTLAITIITDDHADSTEGATEAAIGAAVEGAVDHADDVDYFVFAAQKGQSYRIVLDGVTHLADFWATLFDADQTELTTGWSSMRGTYDWAAPTSGDYYVAVSGQFRDIGSYTLTIEEANFADEDGGR